MSAKTIVFLLLFFPCLLLGQKSISELERKLKSSNDTAYIETCTEIAEEYKNQNNVKEAFEYIDSAITRAKTLKQTKWLGYAYNALGNLYSYAGDYRASLDEFDKALKIYEKSQYVDGKLNIHVNKGNTYYYIGDYKKAEINYLAAQQLYPKSRKDEVVLANIYNNLGGSCGAQEQYSRALNYFLKALELFKKNKDSVSIGYSYNNLGNIELSRGNYKASLPMFEMARDLKLKFGNNNEKSVAFRNLAKVYYDLENYEKALESLKSCLSYTDTSLYNTNLIVTYKELASVHESMNHLAEANKFYKLAQTVNTTVAENELKDQLMQKEMLDQLSTAHMADSLKQATRIQLQNSEIKRSTSIRYFLLIIVILILIFTYLLYKRFRQSEFHKKEIFRQKQLVDEKQKEIVDSISYAEKIQSALLGDELFKEYFKDHFVFFKPKDIVSGDFYWTSRIDQHEELYFLAVCDSTGHGVPGAFMSILNSGFFNEAINEKRILQPNLIFNYIRQRLVSVLGKSNHQDGFDGTLLCFNKKDNKILYAAANNTPLLVRNNELIVLPHDKMPVGKGELLKEFSLFEISIRPGDQLYIYTDGYSDQFGGSEGKKFKSKALKALLSELSSLPFPEQKRSLEKHFLEWKGNIEQIDDVTLIGLKF